MIDSAYLGRRLKDDRFRRDIVVASVGGNALTGGKGKETVEHQNAAAAEAMKVVAQIFQHFNMAVVHGNGPQAGFIKNRVDLACAQEVSHPVPLDAIVADTQGAIGYMFERILFGELKKLDPRLARRVITMLTQVLVDKDDPGLVEKVKPVGQWMDREAALSGAKDFGWEVAELTNPKNSSLNYRQVVSSPRELLGIPNQELLRILVHSGVLVVCGGGGGIPVVEGIDGRLTGVEGVIDKDRTSAMIAGIVGARTLAIATDISGVMLPGDYPEGPTIDRIHADEALQLAKQLPEGSMGPKLAACASFVQKEGGQAVITDFANLQEAVLRRRVGTWII